MSYSLRLALAACAAAIVPVAAAQSIKIPDTKVLIEESRARGPCENCGEIRAIREVTTARAVPRVPGTDGGPLSGGTGAPMLVGGVFYHELGGGDTFVGGVGTPEMRQRFSEVTYEITVRLDGGGYQLLQRRDGTRFRVGDRVRMSQGTIELI